MVVDHRWGHREGITGIALIAVSKGSGEITAIGSVGRLFGPPILCPGQHKVLCFFAFTPITVVAFHCGTIGALKRSERPVLRVAGPRSGSVMAGTCAGSYVSRLMRPLLTVKASRPVSVIDVLSACIISCCAFLIAALAFDNAVARLIGSTLSSKEGLALPKAAIIDVALAGSLCKGVVYATQRTFMDKAVVSTSFITVICALSRIAGCV